MGRENSRTDLREDARALWGLPAQPHASLGVGSSLSGAPTVPPLTTVTSLLVNMGLPPLDNKISEKKNVFCVFLQPQLNNPHLATVSIPVCVYLFMFIYMCAYVHRYMCAYI